MCETPLERECLTVSSELDCNSCCIKIEDGQTVHMQSFDFVIKFLWDMGRPNIAMEMPQYNEFNP